MKRFFTLSLLLAAALIHGQNIFQQAFTTISNNYPVSLVQTSDGGYLVAMNTGLVKTNAAGQPQWIKTFSISQSLMSILEAGESASGGFYMLGAGSDTASGPGLFLSRLDASGNLLWTKLYPGTENSYNYSKVRQTSDGGFMISESNYQKMGAVRTDSSGNVIWSCSYAADTTIMAKNPSFDCQLLSDGSMIFTGKREDDICLVKTDAGGQVQWTKVMNDGMSYYHANAITALSGGGFAVVGYDDWVPFAMKTDAAGNVTWYKNYSAYGSFEQVYEQPNGDLVVAGTAGSTAYDLNIVVLDANGDVNEALVFSAPLMGSYLSYPELHATSDGGFAISSFYTDGSSSSLNLMKTDTSYTFNCNFIPDTITVDPNTTPPSLLSVPIYRISRSITPVAISLSTLSLAPSSMDFCQFMTVNDPLPVTAMVNAYPSPLNSGEALHLEIKGFNGNAMVEVYDATGKRVQQLHRTLSGNDNLEIGTMDFGSGIYFVRISGGHQETLATTKFLVK